MSSSTESDEELTSLEKWWRDHYDWLQEKGYILRSRYKPGWIPSWSGKKGFVDPSEYEDGQLPTHIRVIDAIKQDGTPVCLKKVFLKTELDEISLLQQLTSPPHSEDPENHCVQVIEMIKVEDDPDCILVVMPMLREWDSPPLETVGEAVDFIRQFLMSVHFLHLHGIAHRDIKFDNIMMDATAMYPEGFHFVKPNRTPDFNGNARHYTRTEKPPGYCIIDFDFSKKYNISNGPPLDLPVRGGDGTAPEAAKGEPCDPFKMDIYYVGNVLRQFFTEGYELRPGTVKYHAKKGFGFLEELVNDMTNKDPDDRPTIGEAVERFERIIPTLSTFKLRSRVTEKREWFVVGVVREIAHWIQAARYVMSGLPAIPTK